MVKPVLQFPDPFLRQVALPINFNSPADVAVAHEVATDLADTFVGKPNTIGLAAPQIGHNFRVILVDVTRRGFDRYVMVNPVITRRSEQTQRINDGCQSIDNGNRRVIRTRPLRITVEWRELDGTARRMKFSNLMAACIDHEVDHLNGVLCIDPVEASK